MILVFRHVPHEHLGTIAGSLRKRGLTFRYLDVWKKGARFPRPEDVQALVVLGGPMGVYEAKKYPFLVEEIRFLKAFYKTGRPVLGICLGSQLIAASLGAKVHPNKHKEVGWYPVTLTPAGRKDPLFRAFGKGAKAPVLQWHGDTFTRPRGTAHLARSPLCRHQAIRFRDNVYGLQFHLEVTAAMVREWLRQPGAAAEAAAARPRVPPGQGLRPRAAALARRARAFFDGWARLIPAR